MMSETVLQKVLDFSHNNYVTIDILHLSKNVLL